MLSRSHIYSDVNETNLKIVSLFDHVLIVSLKSNRPTLGKELDSNDFSEASQPFIEWQFPSEVKQKAIYLLF